MKREAIITENAPKAIGPYSQGQIVGDFVYTSGQIPINPKTGVLATEIKEATKQSLENVKAVLEAGGSSLENAFKLSVFVKNMDDFPLVNEVYAEYFKSEPPARSCVQVAKLPMDALIEIEAIGTLK